MILDDEIKKLIEQRIEEIEKEYQQTQGLILTEDDLKCLLYARLTQILKLPDSERTEDPQEVYGTFIHSEITWYDLNNKLRIKPDITILNPKNLRIVQRDSDKLKLPSKEFSFSGDAIIFELKFVRNKAGINLKITKSIKKNFEKIQKVFDRLHELKASNKVFCYFVIFNKTDVKCKEFESFVKDNGQGNAHKIIYASGNAVI